MATGRFAPDSWWLLGEVTQASSDIAIFGNSNVMNAIVITPQIVCFAEKVPIRQVQTIKMHNSF